MDLDIKKVMLALLERQKEYVCEDLESYSCAMVAAFRGDGTSWVHFPKFQGEQEKIAAYNFVVEEARRTDVVVIVTVNHARTGNPGAEKWIEDYRWGDYGETNSQTCILLTASGPYVASVSLTLEYKIVDGQVEFGREPEFCNGIDLNLLPGWPSEFLPLAN